MCRKQQIEPVDLDHCLRSFTSEEKLEQWYYCSHCKGKKPATKKLQIWRLPPILVINSFIIIILFLMIKLSIHNKIIFLSTDYSFKKI